jgi:hypothetical protein
MMMIIIGIMMVMMISVMECYISDNMTMIIRIGMIMIDSNSHDKINTVRLRSRSENDRVGWNEGNKLLQMREECDDDDDEYNKTNMKTKTIIKRIQYEYEDKSRK